MNSTMSCMFRIQRPETIKCEPNTSLEGNQFGSCGSDGPLKISTSIRKRPAERKNQNISEGEQWLWHCLGKHKTRDTWQPWKPTGWRCYSSRKNCRKNATRSLKISSISLCFTVCPHFIGVESFWSDSKSNWLILASSTPEIAISEAWIYGACYNHYQAQIPGHLFVGLVQGTRFRVVEDLWVTSEPVMRSKEWAISWWSADKGHWSVNKVVGVG